MKKRLLVIVLTAIISVLGTVVVLGNKTPIQTTEQAPSQSQDEPLHPQAPPTIIYIYLDCYNPTLYDIATITVDSSPNYKAIVERWEWENPEKTLLRYTTGKVEGNMYQTTIQYSYLGDRVCRNWIG